MVYQRVGARSDIKTISIIKTKTKVKKQFLSEYTILSMKRNSILVQNNKTGKECYIHRNAFNALDDSVDYREINIKFPDCCNTWIEVLSWKRL